MDINFQCDKCGQNLEVDEAGAGMTVDCPKCSKPVYVPSKPKEDEPAKTRLAGGQGSPYADRAAILMRESDDDEELAKALDVRQRVLAERNEMEKYVAKPQARVALTDIDVPFWSVFVFICKVWVSCLILAIVTWPIFFVLVMKLSPHIANFIMQHPSLVY
jgi:DNA-directed RNA polymerase subunit RPC12/RpoP